MTTIAMAYRNLTDIDEVPPLTEADRECLSEIREVLKRHERLDRFGVMLLHTHFPILDDEVLLETCDVDQRRLTLEVAPKTVLQSREIVPTSWRLRDDATLTGCYQACVKAHGGSHSRRHVER